MIISRKRFNEEISKTVLEVEERIARNQRIARLENETYMRFNALNDRVYEIEKIIERYKNTSDERIEIND